MIIMAIRPVFKGIIVSFDEKECQTILVSVCIAIRIFSDILVKHQNGPHLIWLGHVNLNFTKALDLTCMYKSHTDIVLSK